MNTKDLKTLAILSFTNGKLDEKKVKKISAKLKKSQLRKYVKFLKIFVEKNTVRVSISTKPDRNIVKELEKIFKDKTLEIKEDKDLLAGIRIQNYDDIYNLSLKSKLDSMIEYIKEK